MFQDDLPKSFSFPTQQNIVVNIIYLWGFSSPSAPDIFFFARTKIKIEKEMRPIGYSVEIFRNLRKLAHKPTSGSNKQRLIPETFLPHNQPRGGLTSTSFHLKPVIPELFYLGSNSKYVIMPFTKLSAPERRQLY
jgi:hypothetical protein